MQEVGCAVQRVNNPDRRGFVSPFDDAAFFHLESPVGAGLCQFAPDGAFGIDIGTADKIGRSLAADLQVFDFTKIAQQPAAGRDRGFLHNIDQRGLTGHGDVFPQMRAVASQGAPVTVTIQSLARST